jgi:hypothetical protein
MIKIPALFNDEMRNVCVLSKIPAYFDLSGYEEERVCESRPSSWVWFYFCFFLSSSLYTSQVSTAEMTT